MTSTSDKLRLYGQKLRDNQRSLSGTVKVLAEASKDFTRKKSEPAPTHYDQTPSHNECNQGAHPPNTRESFPPNGGGGGSHNSVGAMPDHKSGRLPAVYDPYGDGPNGPTRITQSQKPHSGRCKGGKRKLWAELFVAVGEAADSLNELFSGDGDEGDDASDGDEGSDASDGGGGGGDS